jgi:CheY-like chemotaxis protein
VIEDHDDVRQMISDVLAHCGAMVSVFASAEEALADLLEFVPTVFVCDELCREVAALVASARA